jgi:hypothetical protein
MYGTAPQQLLFQNFVLFIVVSGESEKSSKERDAAVMMVDQYFLLCCFSGKLVTVITIWKDIPYSVSLLWLTTSS